MNEETQQSIEMVTKKLADTAGVAIDMAPAVIEQLVTYNTFNCLFWIVASLALISFAIAFIRKDLTEWDEEASFISKIIAGAIALVFLFVLLANAEDLIKITLAQDVWVIDHVLNKIGK